MFQETFVELGSRLQQQKEAILNSGWVYGQSASFSVDYMVKSTFSWFFLTGYFSNFDKKTFMMKKWHLSCAAIRKQTFDHTHIKLAVEQVAAWNTTFGSKKERNFAEKQQPVNVSSAEPNVFHCIVSNDTYLMKSISSWTVKTAVNDMDITKSKQGFFLQNRKKNHFSFITPPVSSQPPIWQHRAGTGWDGTQRRRSRRECGEQSSGCAPWGQR